MIVLLPPSETKADGGSGPPLDLAALSWPALNPVRERLVSAVQRAAHDDLDALARELGCSPGLAAVDRDLTTSPTLPALERYTGVVYDELGWSTLRGPARRRGRSSLVVASALLGLLRASDPVPAYRFSGGTRLPGVGGLSALWRPVLEPVLADERLVVDLRSGAYAALARVPHAVEVRVLRETGGRRSVVSHDNKYTKGRLARALCERGARDVDDVADAGSLVADVVEISGRRVDLVLHGLASARA